MFRILVNPIQFSVEKWSPDVMLKHKSSYKKSAENLSVKTSTTLLHSHCLAPSRDYTPLLSAA